MKLLQLLKILIVSLAVLIPGFLFLLIGPIPGFEQKEQTGFPDAVSVFRPAPEYRTQFADAIFERSAAKRLAIQFMNALHLYGFGFIETDGVVSGTDQWLFYKPQFRAWDCNRHNDLHRKLGRITLINDLLSASEIPLIFAIAPNKASIERDYLGGRASRYLDCYFDFEKEFTATLASLSPHHFVDHAKVLGHPPSQHSTYLQFDTHWRQASALWAMNQLFESRPGVLGVPLYRPESRQEQASMDILNLLLLLEREQMVPVPVSHKPGPEEIEAANLAPNVLFIHDSFYGRILPYLKDRSPNARFQLPIPAKDVPVRENLEQADIVVVELIQRDFLDFVWSDTIFGWGSIFADWMLDEMSLAAEQCNWTVATDLMTDRRTVMRNVRVTGANAGLNGLKESRIFFQVPDNRTQGRVCLRMKMEAVSPGAVKIFFSAPDASKSQPGYSRARMVSKTIVNGSSTMALVLPETFKGRWVRLQSLVRDGELVIHTLETTSFD